MERKYDVVIAYRVYPGVSKTPFIHKEDKYKLAGLGLRTLAESLGNLRVKLYALLDNCPDSYIELFSVMPTTVDVEIMRLNGMGNAKTFALQLKILSEQNDSEFVYFAEDDYVYMPNQFCEMIDFMKGNSDVDFVSAYDHTDFYTSDLHRHPVCVRVTDKRHWRSANSTCLTFLTTKKILIETLPVFQTYTRGNWDASLWLALTKFKVFDFLSIMRYALNDMFLLKVLGKAWVYTPLTNLFGKKRTLWTPMPSIATHMELENVAPVIDWYKVANKAD